MSARTLENLPQGSINYGRPRWQTVLGRAATQIPAHVLLAILSLLAVLPFLFLVLSAFKPYKELIDPFPTLFPKEWSVATFYEIFTRRGFPMAFWNTVWVAAAVTAVQGLTSSAVGYVFAKYHFPLKETLFKILVACMMIPFVVIMIPLYIQVYQIKLVDNLWALVVIALWNTFGLFTMRSFIEGIPTELIEAARIDGAGEFWIFSQVIMPLALAPLTTISVFTFLGNWDNFLFPSVLINSMDKQTLPLFLNGLRSIYWTRYDLWITGSLLTVVPVLIAYAFSQRTFVRGAQTSGLKG
jgi:multiple sugar transport system permease protein